MVNVIVPLLSVAAFVLADKDIPSCAAQDAKVLQLSKDIEALKLQNQVDLTKFEQESSTVVTLRSELETIQSEKVLLLASVAQLKEADKTNELQIELDSLNSRLTKANEELTSLQAEKEKLVATLEELKQADKSSELEAQVDTLKTKLSAVEKDYSTVEAEKVLLTATVAQLKEADKTNELTAKVDTLEQDKQALHDKLEKSKDTNSAHQRRIDVLQEELSASKKSLAQVTVLKSQLKEAEKKISSLHDDLKRSHDEMSLQKLISKYYDHIVDATTAAYDSSSLYLEIATVNSIDFYQVNIQPWTAQASEHLDKSVQTVQELYATHAAATVDPLLAQLKVQTQPILDVYVPVAEQHVEKAKEEALKLAHRLDSSFKQGRKVAIVKLKTIPQLAPYATKIVDCILFLAAIPIVIALFRIAVSIVLSVLYMALYLVTCCGCCGLAGRKAKSPRAPQVSNPKPVAAKPTKAAAPPATNQAATPPSKKKKGKKAQ
ncbi:hypothetical protein THRCLA_00796 [Thraustotheca clavata]|uniref:Secreted protein n=1 Tax=Thraustotheca clavata TaxID=74557 RepID=A0A1W0AAG1_9STRA|nr:hypothetical protein THRCLA_00796 [Thraustotheca clavata]